MFYTSSSAYSNSFYAKSVLDSAGVAESAKVKMKFTNGTSNYNVFEREYSGCHDQVNDEGVAKTWRGRKCWAIPNIAIGIIKTICHLSVAILLCLARNASVINEIQKFTYCAVRDLEEVYGNFIEIFNDKLGLYHIQQAQFQKHCYHEYGKLPKQNPYKPNFGNFGGFNGFSNFSNSYTSNSYSNFSGSNKYTHQFSDDFFKNFNSNTFNSSYNTKNFYQGTGASDTANEKAKIEKLAEKKKNCEQILGVTEVATVAEIKSAYLKLCRLHHPDKHSIQKVGETADQHALRRNEHEEKFKSITTAHEMLIKIKNGEIKK
ncbi:MAG: J domain-containing protein [Parachlamydiaceae bacterium]|nr:J domain-containing protein [Parachlamydiaceae bacterium]